MLLERNVEHNVIMYNTKIGGEAYHVTMERIHWRKSPIADCVVDQWGHHFPEGEQDKQGYRVHYIKIPPWEDMQAYLHFIGHGEY